MLLFVRHMFVPNVDCVLDSAMLFRVSCHKLEVLVKFSVHLITKFLGLIVDLKDAGCKYFVRNFYRINRALRNVLFLNIILQDFQIISMFINFIIFRSGHNGKRSAGRNDGSCDFRFFSSVLSLSQELIFLRRLFTCSVTSPSTIPCTETASTTFWSKHQHGLRWFWRFHAILLLLIPSRPANTWGVDIQLVRSCYVCVYGLCCIFPWLICGTYKRWTAWMDVFLF